MSSFRPIASDHPAQWHHEKFVEFVKYKQAVGEPSPHMTLAGHLSKDECIEERAWRAGIYGAPYSVLTSEAIWREWPVKRAMEDPDGLRQWIHDNWAGFHVRTERRMVRTPASMAVNILSWRDWMMSGEWQRIDELNAVASDREMYVAWFNSIHDNVYNFGRYITIRVVEFFRRYVEANAELFDIRSIGGESPVRCLTLLYPEHEYLLLTKKDAGVTESLGDDLLAEVQASLPDVGHYVLAAMLCEYRVAYEDRKQYPARTIDQELQYLNGPHGEYWEQRGYHTDLWDARKSVIPHEALGEIQGWEGIRHDLSRHLRDKGENWTDTKYVYPSGDER